jgi:type VI secretion system protein ImpH
MQASQRQREPGLIGQLFAEPWRFGFTSAVTILVRWLARRGIPPDRALTQVLRFENSLSLSFPAAEVEAVRVEDYGDGMQVVLTPTCFGLLGPSGTLPLHDTDRCAQAAARGDVTGRAYLDIYSSRMVALLWQAWVKPRLEMAPDAEGRDTARQMLLGLSGRRQARDDTAAWYAGLLRVRPVSAATLECIIACELELPVSLEAFAGHWEMIEPDQRFALGTRPAVIGGAMLGTHFWRVDRRVRILIGPLTRPDFYRMLPDGPGARQLHDLLILATGQSLLDFEIRLLPGPECLAP